MAAPYKDLRQFLDILRQRNELLEINEPASCHLEITEITDRISKAPREKNKALLFNNVTQADGSKSEIPLLINALGATERMLLSVGADSYKDIQKRIEFFLKPPKPGNLLEAITLLPKLADLKNFLPRTWNEMLKGTAPCQEVVITDTTQHMLDKLPILTCWPDDGGPYITFGTIFVKDPATGERNVGMYRMQKYDNCTTGMHWQKHHDGNRLYENARAMGKDRLEVAVAIGCSPHITFSSAAPLPPGIDELIFAGFLHNTPVEVVKCKTIDNEVPADSEIVLEGYVLVDELRREGPFGDHTGYYSLADDYPVFHLTAMTHRKNPIYQTTIVGKPPQEDCYMGKAIEQIFLPCVRLFVPEIIDMNLPWEGVFHNCMIVSIDKRYPGHAKKIMSSIWGFGQMMFTKYVIVVDKHVDVQNVSEVAFHVFNDTDPKRDMMFAEGPMDALDHATPMWAFGSKVGIDATKKWATEGFTREWPEELYMDDAIKASVSQRFGLLF